MRRAVQRRGHVGPGSGWCAVTDHEVHPLVRQLRERRINMGWSQDRVAQFVGGGRSRVCDWETGKIEPDLRNFIRWTASLGWRITFGSLCCDLHNRHCEPPSELCCWQCTEAGHPEHAEGSTCIAPDLSRESSR